MSFTNYLESKNYTNTTIHNYERNVNLFLQWLKEEGIDSKHARYNDLLMYVRHLTTSGNSRRFINQQLGCIRHYYNYLVKMRKVKDNIAANLFIKGVPRRLPHDVLNEQQLNDTYNSFPSISVTDKRNKIMLGLIIYQGLTSNELSRLEPSHILLKEGKIKVPGSRRSNSRLLDLKAHQVLDVQEYLDKVRKLMLAFTEKETHYLFTSMGTGSNFNNVMTKMMKTLRNVAPQVKSVHQLRTSVITLWLSKEGNMREVQYKAGHKYVSSTEKYQQTNLEDLQKDIIAYHPLK